METIVDQAFGDVIYFDVGGLFELAEIEDALVGDEAVGAFVEDGVVIFEPFGDVVGTEDGNFSCR